MARSGNRPVGSLASVDTKSAPPTALAAATLAALTTGIPAAFSPTPTPSPCPRPPPPSRWTLIAQRTRPPATSYG